MLSQIISLLVKGIGFLGGAFIVWGAVQLGISLKDNGGGGGGLSAAIGWIVGGAVIIAASVYFSSLDVSWAG